MSAHHNTLLHKELMHSIFGTDIPSVLTLSHSEKSHLAKITANAVSQFKVNKCIIDIGDFTESHSKKECTYFNIINLDKPFLFDSIMNVIQQMNYKIGMTAHPVVYFHKGKRHALGNVIETHDIDTLSQKQSEAPIPVSIIHIELTHALSVTQKTHLKKSLEQTLAYVVYAVNDWQNMRQRVIEAKDEIASIDPIHVDAAKRDETISFLQWMLDNHFTFLGIREFTITRHKNDLDIQKNDTASLGILRDNDFYTLRQKNRKTLITPEIKQFYDLPTPLIITKANTRSPVHRMTHLDYIGLKRYDSKGQLFGELRIVGLFTSSAYEKTVESIPVLRRKTRFALEQLKLDIHSHAGKLFTHIINDFPRDELFQIDADTLVDTVRNIMSLDMLPRTEVIVRHDKFERFASALVYIPKKDYSIDNEKRIAALIADEFSGRISAKNLSYPEGHMVRIHYIIGRNIEKLNHPAIQDIKTKINHLLLDFNERVRNLLLKNMRKSSVSTLQDKYHNAFSESYQGAYNAEQAVEDIRLIENAYHTHGFSTHFQQNDNKDISLRICAIDASVSLSQRVPILENFGFKVVSEKSFTVFSTLNDKQDKISLYDMHLVYPDIDLHNNADLGARLEECYSAIWLGNTENDSYNYLIPKANLDWHSTALFRAFGRYLKQAGIRFEQETIAQALYTYSEITCCILELFDLRFNPKKTRKNLKLKEAELMSTIEGHLEGVSSLNDDIILRRICSLVLGIQRTNFYKKKDDGQHNEVISFKIAAKNLDFLPEPRPFAEIFVSSPRVEGVHLRFGAIARGGLRWSDRYSDFRTEILGLVKAQQVKNAVIVPVGAKGGFVPKKLPSASDRDAFIKEGIASYEVFISSLLELSDNIINDKIVAPKNVVRHDGDDAYLVVAADKGTATFSDIANGLSQDRNFWLSDAFASGGSAGYDHKKMGITAKGGWESVKRHFREMNKDIQTQSFTAIGVGDMSGDVFGNGMLLSPCTCLVAAFDHRDIIIDPTPDMEQSFAERKRLFAMGRSSWQDYDKKRLSKGGAIYSRSHKSLALTPEIKNLLNVKSDTITPNELISHVLRMQVDLLWFGGIGTYVRADNETNMDVGDHANDAIRISAKDLRVKVVGEGANLGMTQRARIDFSRHGGRINTDAIDNSAGVNSSDVEVNIKIAFGQAVEKNKLTIEQRNRILVKMTQSVSELVLRNSYEQTLCLSLAEKQNVRDLPFQIAFMRNLESRNLLNRAVEFLPQDSQMETLISDNKGLTRPELSVLIAYAKITLFDEILHSDIVKNSYLCDDLLKYFPKDMQKTFKSEIISHKLKDEIIATILSNSMINNCGPTIIQRLKDETGASAVHILKSYIVASKAFNFEDMRTQIHRLDNKIDGKQQLNMYASLQTQLNNIVVWLLFNEDMTRDLGELIANYTQAWKQGHNVLVTKVKKLPSYQKDVAGKQCTDIPKSLNNQLMSITHAVKLCDIALTAHKTKKSIAQTINAYIDIGSVSSLIELIDSAETIGSGGYYEKLATDKMVNLLRGQLRTMTIHAQKQGDGRKWIKDNQSALHKASIRSNRALADGLLTLAEIVTLTSNYDKLAG